RPSEEVSVGVGLIKKFMAGVALLAITIIAMKWIIPKLSYFLAKSQEMLALFAIGWAVTLAAAGELMGFSAEVGAFLAGVSLASSDFKDTISSRLTSLRDFLLIFFFVNMGSELDLLVIGDQVLAAVIFSVFVLIGNPVIVLIIMGSMGYRKRTSFLAGLTVAQISEFSLIFAGLGLAVGHITEEIVGLITLVGLITIGLYTYMILYSHQIYERISPILSIFQRRNPYRESTETAIAKKQYDIILIGLGRFGRHVAEMLDDHSELSYLGIDFDPTIVKNWQEMGKDIIYGDIEDPDLLERLPVRNVKCIISTIPDADHSRHLIRTLRRSSYKGKIFLTAQGEKDYEMLNTCGADSVLKPQRMAAENFYNAWLKDLISGTEPS
ncbi:MAG TPA: cation:proton antiporter family protein, partial [Bacteroidales bacterium]|nr:cation:proton antiporter family protein [Bacteroidales bacterium]